MTFTTYSTWTWRSLDWVKLELKNNLVCLQTTKMSQCLMAFRHSAEDNCNNRSTSLQILKQGSHFEITDLSSDFHNSLKGKH